MKKHRPARMGQTISEQDASVLDLAKEIMAKKVLAFLGEHEGHGCPYDDPEVVDAVITSLAVMDAVLQAFAAERADQGKPPLTSFGQGAAHKGGWDA